MSAGGGALGALIGGVLGVIGGAVAATTSDARGYEDRDAIERYRTTHGLARNADHHEVQSIMYERQLGLIATLAPLGAIVGAAIGAAIGGRDSTPEAATSSGASPTPTPAATPAPTVTAGATTQSLAPGLQRYIATSAAEGSPSRVLATVDGPPQQYQIMANYAAFVITGTWGADRLTGTTAGLFSATGGGVQFYFE